MKIFSSLPELVRALPELNAGDWVDLPRDAMQALARAGASAQESDASDEAPDETEEPDPQTAQPQVGQTSTRELQAITEAFAPEGRAALRLLVRPADAAPRHDYTPWLPVAVLASHPHWPEDEDLRSPAWQNSLTLFTHGSSFEPLFSRPWQEEDLIDPYWPEQQRWIESEEPSRLDRSSILWAQGVMALSWYEEEPQQRPASEIELRLCEWRLGCPLPLALRVYLRELGCDLIEEIGGPRATQPLLQAYPGIEDILEDLPAAERQTMAALVDQLVSFGEYLGNGNQWCFHRETGAVWYFDHDGDGYLTPMFDDVADYLDSLAVMALCQAKATAEGRDDSEEWAEQLLIERWGNARVRKWRY